MTKHLRVKDSSTKCRMVEVKAAHMATVAPRSTSQQAIGDPRAATHLQTGLEDGSLGKPAFRVFVSPAFLSSGSNLHALWGSIFIPVIQITIRELLVQGSFSSTNTTARQDWRQQQVSHGQCHRITSAGDGQSSSNAANSSSVANC